MVHFCLHEWQQIRNTIRHTMKVVGVTAIENTKMNKVPNIVQEIIPQNLSAKLITLAKFGLVQIMNSRI